MSTPETTAPEFTLRTEWLIDGEPYECIYKLRVAEITPERIKRMVEASGREICKALGRSGVKGFELLCPPGQFNTATKSS